MPTPLRHMRGTGLDEDPVEVIQGLGIELLPSPAKGRSGDVGRQPIARAQDIEKLIQFVPYRPFAEIQQQGNQGAQRQGPVAGKILLVPAGKAFESVCRQSLVYALINRFK